MISSTRVASAQGTQTRSVSFKSQIVALESQQVLALQYDQSETLVVENTMQLLTTPAETGNKYGYNSQLYLGHLRSYLASGGQVTTWAFPLSEPATSSAAVGSITITGTPSVARNLVFYVSGWRFSVGVVLTDDADSIGAKIAAEINGANYIGFTATNASGVVTITCTWQGTSGNVSALFVGALKSDDDEIPTGLTVVTVQPTGGTGDEGATAVLQPLWTSMLSSTEWRTDTVQPVSSTAALDIASNAIGLPDDGTGQGSGLWGDLVYRPCTNWGASTETDLATIKAIGDARKADPNTIIVCSPDAMEFPFEIAAVVSGYVGRSANSNVAHAYKGAALGAFLSGALDLDNDWTRDALQNNVDIAVKSGLTTLKTDDNGGVTLNDVATTYHPDGAVFPPNQFEVNKRKQWNIALTLKNEKLQFLNDVIVESVREAGDQPLATDVDTEKGRVVGLAEGWESFGWIFNRSFTINNMEVGIDTINPDRFNRAIPVLLSGNKRVQSDTVLVDRNINIANESVTIVIG